MMETPFPLQHVAIVWRHVTQLRLLILRQPNIVALPPIAILSVASKEVHDTGSGTQADK